MSLFSHCLSVTSFLIFILFGPTCSSDIKEMREEASNFYKVSEYGSAERSWDRILENEKCTIEDRRKAAAVYYRNNSYEKAIVAYEKILISKEAMIGDSKNFLLLIDKYRITENNLKQEITKIIETACEKVLLSKSIDPYEKFIANRVGTWIRKQEDQKLGSAVDAEAVKEF